MIQDKKQIIHGDSELENTRQSPSSRLPKIKVALGVVMVLLLGYYMLSDSKTTVTNTAAGESTEQAAADLAEVVASVGRHMSLPGDDEPVLAEVTDADALKAQQAFFADAVNGDKLLLFPKSLKAIIYSPSRDLIINAGPIEQGATE